MQPDVAEMFLVNCHFGLKPNGYPKAHTLAFTSGIVWCTFVSSFSNQNKNDDSQWIIESFLMTKIHGKHQIKQKNKLVTFSDIQESKDWYII